MKKITLIILGLALLTGIAGFAQENEPAKEQQKSTSEVVLTQEDFKKNNCQNVGDALKCITGVYVNSEGVVSLRDVSSDKVVVVLDGQRLNTPGTIGVNVAALSIENVEKVELLRGGRSAQYGADAVGGVILISSKVQQQSAKALTFDVKTTYGSYDRKILSLNNMYNHNKFNYILSYKRDMWDGNFRYTNPYGVRKNLDNNHQSSYDIFFKTGLILPDDQNLTASTDYYQADNRSPGMTDSPTPRARLRYDNKTYNLSYDKKNLFSGFNLKAQSYYLHFNTKFDDPDALDPTPSNHDNYAYGLELQQTGQILKILNLSYGYSYRLDKIVSTKVGKKRRDTNSAYTTLTWNKQMKGIISNLETSLALRYDSPTDFNSAFCPRFSLSAGHSGKFNLMLISHVTKSYRAPTFNDLYWPKDNFAVGNPDLVPETGNNYDVGLTFSMGAFSLASNYFVNNIKNLIIWAQDRAVNNLWTPNNISKTETRGFENSATLTFFKGILSLNGEYTYMKALNKSADVSQYNKFIIYRPKNKIDLTTTFRLKNWETNVIYHWVGLRYTTKANTDWLPSYQTIDLNTTYRFNIFGLAWNSTLELTNLGNEDYMKVNGTAEPGRMFKFSLGFNF
ncbi:MAG: TonB-dependent receptor [archaeon]